MALREPRIILIDSYEATRETLATRLRSQGYRVEPAGDSATGANMALSDPPSVVVADLWMPIISGVQLCRLLRSEPATAEVPVILRGETDDPKSRFWAEHAGAVAYVVKGHMGDLVRALAKAAASAPESDGFFLQLSGGTVDILDRIAQRLDAALFESVILSEVRALANAGSFERLFDLLSQLLSQLSSYRWLALTAAAPKHLAIHRHHRVADRALEEARRALDVSETLEPFVVEDEDALSNAEAGASAPIVCPITFAGATIGTLALSTPESARSDAETLVSLVAKELGGPMRMAALVEESQRQALTDSLTGLLNRRALAAALETEIGRSDRHAYPLSLILLDIDHFKQINDRRGHAIGDQVLSQIGALLKRLLRKSDLGARWGGEEFVIALTSTELTSAHGVAERIRREIEALQVHDAEGGRVPVTASLGLCAYETGDGFQAFIDRADRAMYTAKASGRNRVVVEGLPPASGPDRTVN